jgi:uroporphyrinogen-III synthase
MKNLLILRPEPGNGETAARAQAVGLSATSCPLFEVGPVPWTAPNADSYDAVLFTSANAVRHGGPQLARYCHLPVLAVGSKTKAAARTAGFSDIDVGTRDVASLLARHKPLRLLHLCGAHVTQTEAGNHALEQVVVYESREIANPLNFAELIQGRPVVLVHSPRAADRFATLFDETGLSRQLVSIAAISAKAARSAGDGWEAVAIADKPRDEDLLTAAAILAGKRE